MGKKQKRKARSKARQVQQRLAPVVHPQAPQGLSTPVPEKAAEPTPAPAAAPIEGPAPAAELPASRRDFLAQAGKWAMGACLLGLAGGSLRLMVPDFHDGPPERFPIGNPGDFKTGTLTWLREKDLFVLRDEQGLGVFSSRCTHLGCTVRRTQDGFFCPCHGARYDARGNVLAGPARRHLPWYELWLAPDGQLWVDTGKTVEIGTVNPALREAPAGSGTP